MLYFTDLEKRILSNELFKDATDIVIISGFVGWEPLEELLKKHPNKKIILIYGMYAQYKISTSLHQALLEIQEKHNNVDILYSNIPVHSKIYFWNCNSNMLGGYVGSANFSSNGLSIDYKEVLEDIKEESYSKWNEYYHFVRDNSIPITSPFIKKIKAKSEKDLALDFNDLIDKNICRATLLIKKNGICCTPDGSGINWGHQNGHASKNKTDAYIAIRAEYRKNFPSMFPEKKMTNLNSQSHTGKRTRHEEEIEVFWDDGTRMLCVMEGNNPKNGILYPKQISSTPSTKTLGKYLRNRLKLKDDHFVTKEDLEKYGRTHIDIQLQEDGTYYFDFSVNKKKTK